MHFLLLLIIVEKILSAEVDEHFASATVAGEALDGGHVGRTGVLQARVCVELPGFRDGGVE